jgi:hypothetical protein
MNAGVLLDHIKKARSRVKRGSGYLDSRLHGNDNLC